MRQRLLGRRTGMRVSELALGCGLLGVAQGVEGPSEAGRTLAAFVDAGGTLVDTSSAHQAGRAEEIVGDFLAEVGREALFISTKFGRPPPGGTPSLTSGAHRGAMVFQIEQSLRRLKTDHVDLYTAEFPDGVTPVDEILRGMQTLVSQGKVLAIALSNFSAWSVAHAATLAECRGWAPVAALHYRYNLVERAAEREHLPMADALGIAVLAWSPQARGRLARTPPDALPERLRAALVEVAAELGTTAGAVSLAWLLAKGVIPVVGARDIQQLRASLGAVRLELTPDQMERLDVGPAGSDHPAPLLRQMRDLAGIDDRMLAEGSRGALMAVPG